MKTLTLTLTAFILGSMVCFAESKSPSTQTCEECMSKCDDSDSESECIAACVDEGFCRPPLQTTPEKSISSQPNPPANLAKESCEECMSKCDNSDSESECMAACYEEGPCREHKKVPSQSN